ncbi:ABC transporter substrate-binding protein [Alteraurantiacibacter buctensis]|uniref:Peptide ABC transporter substrate-binding protein n=1 Tax=Alteraurantiacibacter buctensis TaxID=1503981 RepID=A0A844YUT9_9SPHN|nr:ABC transporter substrate-binding protein [Alteraurantiacibacter buctensis]MXO70892.1 peptide ABC transporter substrate-binding protein [Alteraurantiacibacter buctensis]
MIAAACPPLFRRLAGSCVALGMVLALAGCSGGDDGSFDVVFMEDEAVLTDSGVRLSPGAQHVRAATRAGLVAINAQGEVVPALADRWNVIENGSIFVFRLRDGTWPNGEELTAPSVRDALQRAIRSLRGTSLGLDLVPVDEVRAMAGRVVEVRLASPMPDLLQVLGQPELGLVHGEGETGPMVLERDGENILLTMRPPAERGLPDSEDWRDYVREVRVTGLEPAQAIERFDDGDVEVVLGGRLGSLPLADLGPLSRGTVRLDPAIGLFGLRARRERGALATPELREALAMAIDRPALASAFNVGGWVPSTRVVAPDLPADPGMVAERWQGSSVEDLRRVAAGRLAGLTGQDKRLTLAIGDAPGEQLLLRELARQFATVGITLVQARSSEGADMVLVDRVARYASPRWFLNQFNCILDDGLCSLEADRLASRALDERDSALRARLMGEAEAALTRANVYIPFGPPLRWSLVRGEVDGFAPNLWAFHPLPDMAVIPR